MPQDETRPSSIELLREPAGADRLAAEVVTLDRQPGGDLVLRARATGVAVEIVMGEGLNDSVSSWTVTADQVDRVLGAAVRELFPDTPTLSRWMAARGIPGVEGRWRGFAVRPVDEDRFLLEALRDVIGTAAEWDEGERMAGRFADWLSRNGIGYDFAEQVGEGY